MRRGFTLVEIMIVVAVVVVLVGLSIPNILRSRVVGYEGVALANLKTISIACQLYHMNQGTYPNDLSDLSESDPPYIDSSLGSGNKQRYEFKYVRVNVDSFTINANPASGGLLKGKYFYVDESGIIRSKADGPAGPTDEIVQ
jgi:prepilin-type N-terminal cleavage/methylation domain-containing protein